MSRRISSGVVVLDKLLDGGFEVDTVTTVYGPSGSGKTNVCMLAAISVARSGRRVIYIDTEGGFSVDRLKQIAPDDFDKVLGNITFLVPTNFEEQKKAFDRLPSAVDSSVGLVVVDSIAMLYRLEMGKSDKVYSVNKDLGLQISYLNELTRKKNIAVLLTNQVYSSFEDSTVKMVGGDILKYGSKCLIALDSFREGIRSAEVKKHRSIPEGRSTLFRIIDSGLVETKV